MRILVTLSVLICIHTQLLRAQVTDDPDAATYRSISSKDRIGIDGGLVAPFGDVAKGLGLTTSWGIHLNFWKFLNERTVGGVTVGNATYSLGTEVQTDSGIRDLSDLSLTTTPLMGAIGYVFGTSDLHPYVMLQAGATFVTLNLGNNRPAEQVNNEAYFTLAGTVGVGYGVATGWTITASARYQQMFGEDLRSAFFLLGVSYELW